MLNPSLGLRAIGLFLVFQGACGGKSATARDASAVGPDGAPALDALHPGDFISADVDGVTVRAEMTACGTKGLEAGQIWANAGITSPTPGWTLYVPNSVGTSACLPDWVALFQLPRVLRSDEGSCSVTVTAAAPALGDVLEGTFTATLTTSDSVPQTTAVVTNGVFHVTRNFE